MAAMRQMAVGSAVRTAAARAAVNVAMPHRRGTEDETKAIRIPDTRRLLTPAMGFGSRPARCAPAHQHCVSQTAR
jgi:hypothetical protein